MSSGISFSGLGSGLDTEAIIKQLIDIERRPIGLIRKRQAKLEDQKSIIQKINTGLLTLKDKAANLADESLFNIVKVTSSDTAAVSVSGTDEAAPGTFTVEVDKLAQARSLSSRSFTSSDQALGLSGEFVVNGTGIQAETTDSLFGLRDRINTAGAGVSAQILNVASGDNRLILTADQVGANGFDLRDASSANVVQSLGFTSTAESIKNPFADGVRSDGFLSDTTAVGTLLGLTAAPTGSITVAGQQIAVDLASESLNDIRDAIAGAGISGVDVQVASFDDGGITRYRLEVSGTTDLTDNTGVLPALGVLDATGALKDPIVVGAESDAFTSTTTSVGSLLGLGAAPAASVTIAGQAVALDLGQDSLTDIQTKINDAGLAGVTATVTSTSNDQGVSQFRLRIVGTTDLVDTGNVLEALGVLEGSNSAFPAVARALTGNAANQQNGSLLLTTGTGFKTTEVSSDVDPLGSLVGSTASGTVAIAGTQVAVDLNTDSLNEVRDRINAAGITGVTATVNITGPSSFELEIAGTQEVVDDNGVLQALGAITAPATMSANTRFGDILGAGVSAGDTISISGVNHDGDQVAGTFTVNSTSQKVDTLLNTVEQLFGNGATASFDSSGRLVLTDSTAGPSPLSVSLTANNQGGGSLSLGTLAVTTEGAAARTSQLQAGQDAEVRVNGITLNRASNTITDALQGVTLTLHDLTQGAPVEISVSKNDTSQLHSQLKDFVDEYNSAMDVLAQQLAFDKNTNTAGPLAGDSTLLSVQARLRDAITTQLDVGGDLNSLVLIGISFDRQGRLTIDDARLTDALDNNLPEVRKLFVTSGTTTDGQVAFVNSTKRTQAGTYQVQVTQAAQRAELLGTVDLSVGGLAQDQTLMVTETGPDRAASIQLKAGDDIDAIVAKLNATFGSQVAEVRRATVANTTDGTTPITAATTFDQIAGAGVADGDTIRIQGTKTDGTALSSEFVITDATTATVGDLLQEVRSTFGNGISAAVDDAGRIVVTDHQLGPSSLTLALVEKNEGGGSLDFGSIDVEEEGRFPIEIAAENQGGRLFLRHQTYGSRAGFTVTQSVDQLGLSSDPVTGADVQGTLDGEAAEGFGRILTGASASDTTEGLAVRVTATPEQVQTSGDLGTVKLVYGVGRILDDALAFITDTFDGTLQTRETAIDDTIGNLKDQVLAMDRRVEQTRSSLVRKFATLEGSLNTLQSQGAFLTQQLAGLAAR